MSFFGVVVITLALGAPFLMVAYATFRLLDDPGVNGDFGKGVAAFTAMLWPIAVIVLLVVVIVRAVYWLMTPFANWLLKHNPFLRNLSQ